MVSLLTKFSIKLLISSIKTMLLFKSKTFNNNSDLIQQSILI